MLQAFQNFIDLSEWRQESFLRYHATGLIVLDALGQFLDPLRNMEAIDELARRYPHLGAPNQYRRVDYVVSESGFLRCLLCGTGEIHKTIAKHHFGGQRHRKKYTSVVRRPQQLEERDRGKREFMEIFHTGVLPMIKHAPWRRLMKSFVYDFIMGSSDLWECLSLLGTVLQMEAISLLELVLWKTNISDDITFFDMQEMREYPILDTEFDAQAFASAMRVSCGAQVIIPLVLGYLGTAIANIPSNLYMQLVIAVQQYVI